MLAVAEGNVLWHKEVDVRVLIQQPVHPFEKEPEKHTGQGISIGANSPQIREAADLNNLVGKGLLAIDLP